MMPLKHTHMALALAVLGMGLLVVAALVTGDGRTPLVVGGLAPLFIVLAVIALMAVLAPRNSAIDGVVERIATERRFARRAVRVTGACAVLLMAAGVAAWMLAAPGVVAIVLVGLGAWFAALGLVARAIHASAARAGGGDGA